MAPSSDEGEIVENEGVNSKATSLPRKFQGNGVDRLDRHQDEHSAGKSRDHGGSLRSRSPRRSRSPPRGHKRHRDSRDYADGRPRDDGRRFRGHYEDSDRAYDSVNRRSRISYDDIDHSPPRRPPAHTYGNDRSRDQERYRGGDPDVYPEKRQRRRSRSPYRPPRANRDREDRRKGDEVRFVRPGDGPGSAKQDDWKNRGSRNGNSAKQRGMSSVGEESHTRREVAKPLKGSPDDRWPLSRDDHKYVSLSARASPFPTDNTRDSLPRSQPELEPETDFEKPTVIDEDAEIERRRKRRAELLAKSSSATPLLVNAVHQAADKTAASSPGHTQQGTPLRMDIDTPGSSRSPGGSRPDGANGSEYGSPSSGAHGQSEHSPALDIMNETDLINRHAVKDTEEDGPSAADYDPTVEMKEDGIRDELRHGNVGLHGEPNAPAPASATTTQPKAEEPKIQADDDDDDDFDMFADDFDEEKYAPPKQSKAEVVVEDKAAPKLAPPVGGILEGDDKDGYYKVRIGEVIAGQYQIQAMLGKGMFSGVARAIDITTKKLVAIKIMRNNDALRKGGYTEINILQKLNDADPEGRKHIVKFERHFDFNSHLCMAFENLSLNLREVLRKFGNNVGINLGAVRAYAHQIFVGLAHMRKCSIVHADLKPDNILVNESRNTLKICDLGTAIDRSDAATAHNEITPYLVSRFYRAPEIILGMPYDYSIDMWSIGCTLYELYTGKILFAGDSNNQMLKAIMEIRGRFTPKLYKRGQLSTMHFDDSGNFISVERDKVLNKTAVRTLSIVKPTRDLRTRLTAASADMTDAESKDLNLFIELLEQCLALNPEKRIKPTDALKHPFFTSKVHGLKR